MAVVQSNYIPWKGYFDLINSVDEFVLLDDVQYTRRDWRNRNRIKTASGLHWLTVPVRVKGRFAQTVRETRISDPGWARRHLATIRHHYAAAPHFDAYRRLFAEMYLSLRSASLSEVNREFLQALCGVLGISTRLSNSSDYRLLEGKTRRLVDLCRQTGAEVYVSGPAARGYLDEELFAEADIRVEYFDYSGYPEYPQLHPPFEHAVSIIDLLCNTGPEAPRFMKTFPAAARAEEHPAETLE